MKGAFASPLDVFDDHWSWPGAMVGLLVLAGVALIVAGLPVHRRPSLDDRLEPYLRDTPRPSTLLMAPGPARGPEVRGRGS